MDWFAFALLSATMFAVGNIIDKFALTKKIRNPYSYNVLTLAMSLIPALLLVFYIKLSFDFLALLATFYGFALAFLFVAYNKAMMKGDASRIISITRISPVFVLVLSFIFLNEVLNYQKYIGIIFLVSGAIVASYKKSNKRFQISAGVSWILLYAFGGACLSIILKYALGSIDYWTFFFWELIGNLIGCAVFLLMPSIRRNLSNDIPRKERNTLLLIVLSSDLFSWLGYLFYFIAVSSGYVSLTSAVGSVQPLIVFAFTLLLTILSPKILKEEISKMSLTFKMLAIIFIIIGSCLIVVI